MPALGWATVALCHWGRERLETGWLALALLVGLSAAAPMALVDPDELALVLKAQFEDWSLTQTEREVAMLLLKGLSFKEIAAVRDTMEKTVRQQASAIYKKANVSGRHAFSAWFIEDLL